MANNDPTGSGHTVALHLDRSQIAILREAFGSCLEGLRDDLQTPWRLGDPERSRRETVAYERLLTSLERGEIVVPDAMARRVVGALAASSDEANEYERVVAEHDALHRLLRRLESARRQR
ncbi:MAG: hypothetical protein WBM00_05945 [Solirubrobacterales bacterium]